ncbi:MAG TPA: hypothetical protein VLA95_11375 [Gemmatimonadales bacterium]|nr:hypothetical protein [Gemmatimonadales bacterium]
MSRWCAGLLAACCFAGVLPAQPAPPKAHLPVGLFFGRIEEGARIFTPARLLPLSDPEALGHDFPTALQLHGTEFPALLWLGQQAGLRLHATLQRYPTEPGAEWPYPDFAPPPDTILLRAAVVERRGEREAPLPGLRAVLYDDRRPVLFLVDTRSLTLAQRGMTMATTMGLDLSRAEFLAALTRASQFAPAEGLGAVIFSP